MRKPWFGVARQDPGPASTSVRPELTREADPQRTPVLLALMMLLLPALGAPIEEMLQDSFKSMLVAFTALIAALLFFVRVGQVQAALRWHGLVTLPLMLCAWAVGSMVWSHTYLGGVEAVRWFIFSLLLWLGLNTFSRERLPVLAAGIHAGAVIASLWAALQFWIDWRFFPQGPSPASTFVNRNFFAEFAVCALPFGLALLASARGTGRIALLAASTALVIVAILMTGTRSALVALWLQLLIVLPAIGWRWRRQFAYAHWDAAQRAMAVSVLLLVTLGLGSLETGSAAIAQEGRGLTPIARALHRTESIRIDDHSLALRLQMWKATLRMIADRPLSGVGAGAWENEIPLYQPEGAQLETDYYVHNEYLQLVAEYGLIGWLFLVLLLGYLLQAAWRTVRLAGAQDAEAPWRAVALASLLALLVVSAIGFPWRLAGTGALFALALGVLAASDARLGPAAAWTATRLPVRPGWPPLLAMASAGCLVLAIWISQQAITSEYKIVRATRMALAISGSSEPHHPRWNATRADMLRLIREGTQINPHYRKITPLVADELARWGDWRNAVWIWESVLSSRPHIVAILANVARGYAALGDLERAMEYLERARRLQPRAQAVRSLEILLLGQTGREAQALERAREALDAGAVDLELLDTTFRLAVRRGDYSLAQRVMDLRLARWPEQGRHIHLQLGRMYDSAGQEAQALEAFTKALALARPPEREHLRREIPASYRERLGFAPP